ncbi:MAG: hypothetical protein NVS2B12_23810 [Ktedonobacteraceae bacterium]
MHFSGVARKMQKSKSMRKGLSHSEKIRDEPLQDEPLQKEYLIVLRLHLKDAVAPVGGKVTWAGNVLRGKPDIASLRIKLTS